MEKERILRCKGTVTQDEGDAPRVNGSLMVSRAFGDFSMKFANVEVPEMNKNWSKDFCVTAEPDILVFPRSSKGLLAIFSDGLVEKDGDELKSYDEVSKMIISALNNAPDDYSKVAELVLNNHMASSSSPYSGDDTTLILIDIGIIPVLGGALTKKARRLKRLKKQTKRSTEGLKTITI
jgi:serine/threonine protein phosphatase PrpC